MAENISSGDFANDAGRPGGLFREVWSLHAVSKQGCQELRPTKVI